MAPGSQEATFLSEDEHEEGESSMARVSDKVPLAGRTMVAKSTDIDFLKSDKTSLKELTNSEFCKTEEELD
jgi:hypothetical protein